MNFNWKKMSAHWILYCLPFAGYAASAAPSSNLYYTTATTPLCFPEGDPVHYICGDQSWSGFFKGTRIKVVEHQGEWASVASREQGDRDLWLKMENVIPAEHVTKAAVVQNNAPLYDDLRFSTPMKDWKISRGDLVFIVKHQQEACQINIGAEVLAWTSCSALSADRENVKAADTVERVRSLKGFQDWAPAIALIENAQSDARFPFKPLLVHELPELQKGLADLKAQEAQPDYQDCFNGYFFREGEKD